MRRSAADLRHSSPVRLWGGRTVASRERWMRPHPTIKRQQGGNGMALTDFANEQHANPVDVVEGMATTHDWSFARASEDEVTLVVAGKWSEYQVSFTWMSDIEALHLACAFELRVPQGRRNEVIELAAKVNEQLWVGHFDVWFNDGLVMFRHALLLTGGIAASRQQCESALGTALEACERYYQAFQFVLWAGKSATEALDAILFETSGEA
jgi:hypothetical protein